MPFVIAALGAIAAAYFWANRARNAAYIADDMIDIAQTALGAARRFNFRRKANTHPIDCIDDSKIAVGALAVAFLELGGLPTVEDKATMKVALRSGLRVSEDDAEELSVLGSWMIQQCKGADAAFTRLARRLRKLTSASGLDDLMPVLTHIVNNLPGALTARQQDALSDLDRIFRN
ncbi:MAG: hypothetical protein OEZ19_02175 [Paracoccaceae bacterium]|nr:hypothetical protein [Paracoccaceae bacterium]